MIPGKDIEDCEIMKHRFDGFDREMNANASRVAVVNQLARQLLHVDHPGSEEIIERQNQLNTKWSSLREKSEMKREELNSAHGVQTFHIECRVQLLSLHLGLLPERGPLGVELVLPVNDLLGAGVVNMQELSGQLVHHGNTAGVGVHFSVESVKSVFHNLTILDILPGDHRVQHLLLLLDPLLHTVGLGEQFVERQSVQQPLLPDLGHLQQLLVPPVNGGNPLHHGTGISVLLAEQRGLIMELVNGGLVVLQLIRHLFVLLEESLNVALVLADVVTGYELEDVQHPVVHIVSVGEELVEVHGIGQHSLPLVHQVDEVSPSLSDLLDSLLDLLTAEVSLLDKFVSATDGDLEGRLVAEDLRLQSFMFGEKEVDGGEVVANVGLQQDLLHLLHPVLLLRHVPVELPQKTRLLQPGSSLHGELHQLGVGVLQGLDSLHDNGGVAGPVAVSGLLVQEPLRVLHHLLHSLAQDVDVGLHQAVLLQEVLHAHQMLAEVITEETQLEFLHAVEDVEHLLEVVLQLQTQLQPGSSRLQKLQEIIPESEDVVLPGVDSVDVVVVLGLQLQGHGHHGLHSLLVGEDVRLDSFVLFSCGLNRRQVEAKVVLRDETLVLR